MTKNDQNNSGEHNDVYIINGNKKIVEIRSGENETNVAAIGWLEKSTCQNQVVGEAKGWKEKKNKFLLTYFSNK